MKIGEKIKQRRIELEMSQDELARILGYKDRSTLSYIEKDGEKLPVNKVNDFAKALKVDPRWLMGYEDVPKPEPANQELLNAVQDATPDEINQAIAYINFLKGQRK